ncbi:hypothetical protein HJC23_008735 [Cyclotella cryptica]|uniref:Uncharacterized protein n=1 Tax=Cyclotella cryptica TaxID=29204 RepID=A0ABD3PD93_9STRA|eukprot:CCRYP_015832-RB/>CCRYP_015832-RB protein AED:0.28 eAED:0.28 QI:344/1/1/1/0/0/3/220/172
MSPSPFVYVPTFADKTSKPKQISTKEMTSQDLARLKMDDPFLYYSIPAVQKACFLRKDDDVYCLTSPTGEEDLAGSGNQSYVVKRQTRLSFECHSSALTLSLFDLNSDDFDFDTDDELDDQVYSFLGQLEHMIDIYREDKPQIENVQEVSGNKKCGVSQTEPVNPILLRSCH